MRKNPFPREIFRRRERDIFSMSIVFLWDIYKLNNLSMIHSPPQECSLLQFVLDFDLRVSNKRLYNNCTVRSVSEPRESEDALLGAAT